MIEHGSIYGIHDRRDLIWTSLAFEAAGCSNYNRTHQSVPFRALPAIRGPNGLGALDLDACEDLAVVELGKPSEA